MQKRKSTLTGGKGTIGRLSWTCTHRCTQKTMACCAAQVTRCSAGACTWKEPLKGGTFSGSLVLKTWPSSAAGVGSIPDLWQGARIPHASWAKNQHKTEAILQKIQSRLKKWSTLKRNLKNKVDICITDTLCYPPKTHYRSTICQ